jgi:hypothetical protein
MTSGKLMKTVISSVLNVTAKISSSHHERAAIRGSDFGPYTEARFVILEADEVVHELGNKALGSDYTGSEEVLRLASHWLSTCLKTNKTCDSHLEPK